MGFSGLKAVNPGILRKGDVGHPTSNRSPQNSQLGGSNGGRKNTEDNHGYQDRHDPSI